MIKNFLLYRFFPFQFSIWQGVLIINLSLQIFIYTHVIIIIILSNFLFSRFTHYLLGLLKIGIVSFVVFISIKLSFYLSNLRFLIKCRMIYFFELNVPSSNLLNLFSKFFSISFWAHHWIFVKLITGVLLLHPRVSLYPRWSLWWCIIIIALLYWKRF